MSNKKINNEEAKQAILERMNTGIDFKTLRKELSGCSRRDIKLLLLEIMDEQKISEVPFPGLLRKRRKANPPLKISEDFNINVKELLDMKEFSIESCIVKYSIGPKKITVTIKEKKDNNVNTISA